MTIRAKTSRSPTASSTSACQEFANVLKAHGVKKGDRVTIYLPMIPESGLRDARVRAHRRHSLGRLRWLFAREPRESYRGCG